MSRRKPKKIESDHSRSPIEDHPHRADGLLLEINDSLFDSRLIRWIVSIVLIIYMAIVLLGPLSNPVGSEFLTRPLANSVAPVHRTLFLGHGYRFFGPDPGPSHSVIYRITDRDGNLVSGRFPDRQKNWPRLMYHRWFMLSETVFQEHALTPDEKSFHETDKELKLQIQALRSHGKFALSDRMLKERTRLDQHYANSRRRIDRLVSAIGRFLLTANDGQRIELFVQERNIPYPVSVLTGEKLTDDKFLSPLTKIGEFGFDEQREFVSLETAPETSEANK